MDIVGTRAIEQRLLELDPHPIGDFQSASTSCASMSARENASVFATQFPLALQHVEDSAEVHTAIAAAGEAESFSRCRRPERRRLGHRIPAKCSIRDETERWLLGLLNPR